MRAAGVLLLWAACLSSVALSGFHLLRQPGLLCLLALAVGYGWGRKK